MYNDFVMESIALYIYTFVFFKTYNTIKMSKLKCPN